MGLEIKNLTKTFGDKKIFTDFSFSFPDKGLCVITGVSGIGKTTLLRLIAGLDTEFEGSIVGGGIGNVSFAFQEYRLFPQLSALDNIVLSNFKSKNEAEIELATKMLQRLGFSEKDMQLYPNELSGGMKQRVSLARAFIKKAPILLLDEPTKELDYENAKLVKDIIRDLSCDRLIILVTHNITDADELNSVKIAIN